MAQYMDSHRWQSPMSMAAAFGHAANGTIPKSHHGWYTVNDRFNRGNAGASGCGKVEKRPVRCIKEEGLDSIDQSVSTGLLRFHDGEI